jgi:DNA-binding Xre family transcriptional regulator
MAILWRVAELAEEKGWNARRLASEAGVDVKTARNLIHGRATRVDLETIERVADALGVELGALWKRSPVAFADRWIVSAGAAGFGGREEIDRVLTGAWDEETDPALERASR